MQFLRSDLFRNFIGGFLVGAIGILTLQPAEQTDELKSLVKSAYSQIA